MYVETFHKYQLQLSPMGHQETPIDMAEKLGRK